MIIRVLLESAIIRHIFERHLNLHFTTMGNSTSPSRRYSIEGQAFVNTNNTSSFRRARGQVENTLRDFGAYLPFYKAAVEGKWREAQIFLEQEPEALTARISIASETALHIAVGTGTRGHDFVKNLVMKMTPEDLTITDQHNETAFSLAAVVGNIEAAKILVNKNPNLPNICGNHGFPIHRAAQFSHKEMIKYLLQVTKADIHPNPFTGEYGGRLLNEVIAADFFDIALDLVRDYPEIATAEPTGLGSPLAVLARKPDAFPSGRVDHLIFSDRINPFKYVSKVTERNVKEQNAVRLVQELCKEILELDDSKVFSLLRQALHDAAKLGIPEIIEEIVTIFPPAIWFTTDDKDEYNVFQLAMLHRRENVFNLINQMSDYKLLITRFVDTNENNMLHLVGKLPPADRLSLVSGPALLVQREMQWYNVVKKFIYPSQRVAKNKDGKTPQMVFIEEHRQLLKDGAKWMKHTASSSAVFATLIATVAFAGGMHVPGGTDDNGRPYLRHRTEFIIFAVMDAVSLCLAVVSILAFLYIITARYSEEGFVRKLPFWLMVGIGVLFAAITVMLVAFCFALYLLFTPANTKSKTTSVLLYGLVIAILLGLFCILYNNVWPIHGSTIFGKKRDRLLH